MTKTSTLKTYLMELYLIRDLLIHIAHYEYIVDLRRSWRQDYICDFGLWKILFCFPYFPLKDFGIIFFYHINDTFKKFHSLPFYVDVHAFFHETYIFFLLPNFLFLLVNVLQIYSDTKTFSCTTVVSASTPNTYCTMVVRFFLRTVIN